jgi:hypothetical protein
MNPDRDYDNDAEKAIISDLERVDALKAELTEVKRQRDMLVKFVESLVDAFGPHNDIQGSSVIPAAYVILSYLEGGGQ